MALSRLLLPKTRLHSCKMGQTHFTENICVQHKLAFRKHFLGSDCRICEIIAGLHTPSKWFSSSSSSSSSASENVETVKSLHSKKLVEAAKEQRCVAAGSDLKEYRDTHQAVVPKATEVQNKVAGSWYNLKDIVKNLKDKMLENHRLFNYVSSLTSNRTIDTRPSEVTREIPHNTEPESIVQCAEAISQSQIDEKVASVNTTSNIIEENSKYIISTTAYEVIKKRENEDDNRSDELESRVCVSVTITDSLGGESHVSSDAASDMTRKATHKDMTGRTVLEDKSLEDEDWTKGISKRAEQVEPDNGHRQATEAIMEPEHSFGITSQLLSEASTTFDEDDSNKMVSVGNLNCQSEENIATSGETAQASSEVDEKSASSGSAQKAKRLVDLFTRSMNKRAAPEIDNNNILTPEKSLEFSNEPLAEDVPKSFDMKGLINCIKELPRERLKITSQEKIITNKTDQVSTSGSIGRIQSAANLQMIDNKETQTSMKGHAMNEDDEVSGSIGTVLSQTDVQISKKKQRKTSLKGPTLGKECKKSKGSKEKPSTVISFMKALENNIMITSSSSEDTHKSTYIPDLIGDPDAPVALIKNPTRTVMIKQLTKSISSRHLKEALSFCGSGLTSIFMDSSSSSTYVEFESEDAKERAIAKHSIDILGEKLLIFRIDSPRTTVVRISNLWPNSAKKVRCICNSFGEVRIQKQRNEDTIDVHFSLTEWPNMLKILNNLNGMEIAGSQVRAQPAPIFPPEILNILWNQSDERRHVKGVIRRLLQTLENPVGVPELADLMASTIEKNFK